jgi:hypothetical protein
VRFDAGSAAPAERRANGSAGFRGEPHRSGTFTSLKALVTGRGGFIASHLPGRLLRDGNEVMVVDNLATGDRENLLDIWDDIGIPRARSNPSSASWPRPAE